MEGRPIRRILALVDEFRQEKSIEVFFGGVVEVNYLTEQLLWQPTAPEVATFSLVSLGVIESASEVR